MALTNLVANFSDLAVAQTPPPTEPVYVPDIVLNSRDIRPTFVDAPVFSANFGPPPPNESGLKGKKWLQIAVDFTAENRAKGYLDELKIKISVEGRQYHDLDDREGVPVLLQGETTFLDVPAHERGSKSTVFFYISPMTIDRFGGQDKGFRFLGSTKSLNNNNIRIEGTLAGKPIVFDPDSGRTFVDMLKDDEKWVEQCQALPHQVLSKDRTPWSYAWTDQSLLIKPENSGG